MAVFMRLYKLALMSLVWVTGTPAPTRAIGNNEFHLAKPVIPLVRQSASRAAKFARVVTIFNGRSFIVGFFTPS